VITKVKECESGRKVYRKVDCMYVPAIS